MKNFKFDPGLPHQATAIDAVVDLFDGQGEASTTDYETNFQVFDTELFGGVTQTETGIGNHLTLDSARWLKNTRKIQQKNDLEPSTAVKPISYGEKDNIQCPHFSIEMETGTGKTYVYLRTIFELHKRYGFAKFIIIVPSIAIREGTLKTIEMTRDHLRGLYDNVPFDHFVYDSKHLGKVRQFASNNTLQLMIINIQAFNRRNEGVIFQQEHEKLNGRRPVDFVSSTNPIVLIDEPQSVDNTPAAQKAIQTLNPLCTLRYSATHRNPYNLLYKLDPVRAYDLRLVKQIEVSSVVAQDNFNDDYLRLEKVELRAGGSTIRAKVKLHVDDNGKTKVKTTLIKRGDDLAQRSDRPGYADGWIVTQINAEPGFEYVEFGNGRVLRPGDEFGGQSDDVLRLQIRETVERHLMKEVRLKGQGIKVLSLFFIDRVANYRFYDEQGHRQEGKFAQWFEEAYNELLANPIYKDAIPFNADQVHDGYFSKDKKQFTDTSGTTQKDADTYALIMQDKERLLSESEPLRFIFSHSALKEGWDNPNVFQICTLREMGTESERRQTLGRGLRLARDSEGEVVHDEVVNRLTVIAGESFEDYATGLQTDIERDTGIKFGIIQRDSFRAILKPAEPGQPAEDREPVGRDVSDAIWNELHGNGYLDEKGNITNKFAPDEPSFELDVCDEHKPIRASIIDVIRSHIFKGTRLVDVREKKKLTLNKTLLLTPEFKELWECINKKTTYAVKFDSKDLIKVAAKEIAEMPTIRPVVFTVERTQAGITQAGVEGLKVFESEEAAAAPTKLPDILAYLQKETELTRQTLVAILKESGRLDDFLVNPQAFMNEVAKVITRELQAIVIDGITYERIAGEEYEVRLFEEKEIESYIQRLYEVQKSDRTLWDYVPWESTVEKEFAEELDSREEVKFFLKLPSWFRVKTPLGDYLPDWAIVAEKDQRVYLVAETKGTMDKAKRRLSENNKIRCGSAHFQALDVHYKDCTTVSEALGSL